MANTTIVNPATHRPLGKIATAIVESMAGIDIIHRGRKDWPVTDTVFGNYAQVAKAVETLAKSGLLTDITPAKHNYRTPFDRNYTLSPLALVLLSDRMQAAETNRHEWHENQRREREMRETLERARQKALTSISTKAEAYDLLAPDLPDVVRILTRLGNGPLASRIQEVLIKVEALDKVN